MTNESYVIAGHYIPGGPRKPMFTGDYSFNKGRLKTFSIVDYFIFAGILVVSASIGFFYAWKDRRKRSVADFLLAGRNMSSFPVGMSLLASFMSAITLLGTPAEMYAYTTIYWWVGLSYFFVIAGAAHIYIPIFYNLKLTSAYEYLERRFSRGVRTVASCTFVFQMMAYMSLVLYAPSLALHSVTGFTLWGSVFSVGTVCTIYTALGGMKAVLWTDTFQVAMMIGSLVAILTKASLVVGTWNEVWESGVRTGRIYFSDFRLDPRVRHTFWSLLIGSYFTWVAIFGCNQAQVQRASTCPTLATAQRAMWMNFPGLCAIHYLCCFIGIYIGAFYENCDPIKSGFIDSGNQVMPVFVMDTLGDVPGLPGLFVAGLFSGALSTISSGLNSIAAVILEDVIRAYFKPMMRLARATSISQMLALFFGILCLFLTYIASLLGNILQAALSLYGMVASPLLGVFTLGMLFPWANVKGAYCGLLGSLAFMFLIGIGARFDKADYETSAVFTYNCNLSALSSEASDNLLNPPPAAPRKPWSEVFPLFAVSYLWYSVIAVTVCITVGLVVSFITGPNKPENVDARLICPLFDILFPFSCLPESFRKHLRFGIVHEGKYTQPTIYDEMVEEFEREMQEKVRKASQAQSFTREVNYSEFQPVEITDEFGLKHTEV